MKWRKHLPWMLCAVYGFYPAMYLLGGVFKFGYVLRNPTLCMAIAAGITIAAAVILLCRRLEFGRAGEIGLTLAFPLACLHGVMTADLLDRTGLVLGAVCWVVPGILYLVLAKKRRAGIALVALTAFLQAMLIPGMLMFCWFNPAASRTQCTATHTEGGYVYASYTVDEGALGEHGYAEIRSAECIELIFGKLYPHFERIIEG